MEPISLITAIMTVLTPFVKKGAEEFAGAAGQDAYEKAKTIFEWLKVRWNGEEDQEALNVLKNFEKKPERYESILRDILQEKLAQDKELFEQLSKFFPQNNPKLQIAQNMDGSEDVTGLKANKMNKGTATVKQDINQSKKIIGADIDSIG
ncbi:hypothetical protein [uncultured Nostoc sp.]|uniref:hypothetical protein n=1 Tax=uncultured Nostoc sp. TaxID=340711 RepID=UPI0035C973E9